MKKFIKVIMVVVVAISLAGCAALDDAMTTFESDTKGLERTVTVYSKTGEVLKEYEGTNVRTEVNSGGQLLINLGNGKRVQVINADVIVEEKID